MRNTGIGVFEDEHLRVAIAFDFDAEAIRAVYAVINAEKLAHTGSPEGAPAL